MDLEASIAEQLQKLKEWQIEQQERLLKQQQMQREVLSHEQDRICKALGLSIHDLNDTIKNVQDEVAKHELEIDMTEAMKNSDDAFEMIEKGVSTNANALCETYKEEETDDSDHTSAIVDKNRNSVKRYSSGVLSQEKELNNDLLIEGIKPLDNVVSKRCVSIDDIPLPSPKKDFHTLLEEKLRRESEAAPNARNDAKTKPKKPFLKKGQGLSRFNISKKSLQSTTPLRKHSVPLFPKHCIEKNKSRKSTICEDVVLKSPNSSFGNRQLNLKTVPLPRNKILIKAGSVTSSKQTVCNTASNRSRCLPKVNMSDFDSKAERELEEVRIFELLEEKAENSSFCSTSSTVLAFLQQSTPFKVKKLNCANNRGNTLASPKQHSDERASGTIERKTISQQSAHMENLKIQHQFKQLDICKHSRANSATIDLYSDAVTVDMQEKMQEYSTIADQLSNDEAHLDYFMKNRNVIAALSDNEEEEGEDSNNYSLARDNEANANHRVRFSEYNEYRTITDLSDAADKSPLRDYLEQEDWKKNRSSDTSESSDVEEELSSNYEEQTSPLKVPSNEEAVDVPKQVFMQEHLTKDSYYRLTKAISVPEEENPNCEDESPSEDSYNNNNNNNKCTIPTMEEIVQTSDEEQSVLSSSLSSDAPRGLNMHNRKEYVPKSEPEETTTVPVAEIRLGRQGGYFYHPKRPPKRTFESELLKSRLLELEKEIDIFRKESSALLLQRRKLQEDQTTLRKEYAEKERNFEEDRKRVQNRLEEERKRLARERVAMESRIRDAQEKARQSKLERQKAQSLQEQLEQLRDELNVRESRWNAAESRYKCELRVLRVEISKLKEEITTLRNSKRTTNVRNVRRAPGLKIAKAINQINKHVIATPSKELPAKDLSSTLSDASAHDGNDEDEDGSKQSMVPTNVINVNDNFEQMEDMSVNKADCKQVGIDSQSRCYKITDESKAKKKQHLYANLLKDATSDFAEDQNPIYINKQCTNDESPRQMDTQSRDTKNDGRSQDKSSRNSIDKDFGSTAATRATNADVSPDKGGVIRIMQNRTSPEKKTSWSLRRQSSGTNINDIVNQIQYSNGHTEYWYPNGNVKKVFPDRGVTKMIYYNGDVRETEKDGKVKYFYAKTQTWHTTTPDGLEILEFSDGQVEKRATDGTVEVSFPDGAIRVTQADGTEKWSLPDGTVAQTFVNGDKILTFPNGQREIHTKEHRRREYPDGTVKLIYADGTQETRYSTGRKRLKDKDGNLLMDSYDS